jgi:hypothetical protein
MLSGTNQESPADNATPTAAPHRITTYPTSTTPQMNWKRWGKISRGLFDGEIPVFLISRNSTNKLIQDRQLSGRHPNLEPPE